MKQFDFQYKCQDCGECCKNWNPARFDPNIVDKNGICIYLDQKTNLCTIYETRPDFCRDDVWYELQYKDIISLEEYLRDLTMGCRALIEIGQRRKNQ